MAKSSFLGLQQDGDTFTLELQKRIVSLTEAEVLAELDQFLDQLKQRERSNVVADLAELNYFGSMLLELFQTIWKQIRNNDGKLALYNVSEVGREILRVSKFDTLWSVCESRDEALAAING